MNLGECEMMMVLEIKQLGSGCINLIWKGGVCMALITIDTDVMTAEEVACYIGCKEWTVKEMSRMKKIPFYKVGRLYRYKKSSIDGWIKRQEEKNYKA